MRGLTKFLRGGPDQLKAREHLSLESLESCTNGRGAHAKACGLRNSFRETGELGPRICRVISPTSGDLVSELSDPESFGPLSLVRRKKTSVSQIETKPFRSTRNYFGSD